MSIDRLLHIQSAHPKRNCNRPLKDCLLYSVEMTTLFCELALFAMPGSRKVYIHHTAIPVLTIFLFYFPVSTPNTAVSSDQCRGKDGSSTKNLHRCRIIGNSLHSRNSRYEVYFNLYLRKIYHIQRSIIYCIFSADENDFDPYLFLEVRSKQMRDICPEGIDRCHCLFNNGTYVTGPFYYEDDPVGAVVTYVGCNPDFCYCKNTPTIERDSRPLELASVMDLCPRNEMSRCLCHDNTKAAFPFDMSTFFFKCRPKRVRKIHSV
jgi:hypothetical protein